MHSLRAFDNLATAIVVHFLPSVTVQRVIANVVRTLRVLTVRNDEA
jgi:hypothetical protein